MKRRQFLKGAAVTGAISTLDWLRYFKSFGVPGTAKTLGFAQAVAAQAAKPHYLIYWFQEGGWDGYSMFNPVAVANDATRVYAANDLNPSPSWSAQNYRPKGYGTSPNNPPQTAGAMNYGFLAANGSTLFNDMAVVSSHQGNQFHSGGRWDYHYGKYQNYAPLTAMRGTDERTVMQAFCEAYGQNVLLPHISWHRWLADGELSLTDYPVGTGYFENLGPVWAHTIYGKTPTDMRTRLAQIQSLTANARDNRIRKFVDNLQQNFLKDKNSEEVKAFASAVQIHTSLVGAGSVDVNPSQMFTDTNLRAAFNVTAADESPTSTVVNGNPARSKETPNTNVQAMMTYELMTKGLSIGFFIESRDIRGFDSHLGRGSVLGQQGQTNQLSRMNSNLWAPLTTLVSKLKNTAHPAGGSYWDYTNIVLASEMGRMMNADASDILAGNVSGVVTDQDKYAAIMDQDVCQHWYVSSCAFLGGNVKGGKQYGKTIWPLQTIPKATGGGTQIVGAIPIMPDGTLDPAFDPNTGALISGRTRSSQSFISDAGNTYATALYLSGLDSDALRAAGKGRNISPAMKFVSKT